MVLVEDGILCWYPCWEHPFSLIVLGLRNFILPNPMAVWELISCKNNNVLFQSNCAGFDRPISEYLPLTDWGRCYAAKDTNITWFIPGRLGDIIIFK